MNRHKPNRVPNPRRPSSTQRPLRPRHPFPPHAKARIRLCGQTAALLLGASTTPMQAFDAFDSPSAQEKESLESLWKSAVLYRNAENPILQEFKLRGRYQGQFHATDASEGSDSEWEDRRSRFGFDAKLLDSRFELRVDAQGNDGFEDAYDGLVDAYVRWKADESLSVIVGRTKPYIGSHDWLESSNKQPTFERSQIFNQLDVDRAAGIGVEGVNGKVNWQAGIFSNSVDPDRQDFDQALGAFNASWALSLGAGYDASHLTGLDRSEIMVHWLHSDRDADSNVLARYEDIVSVTLRAQDGRLGAVAEAFAATGGQGADGDVCGGYVLGTYDCIPKRLQLVGRYSIALGDGPASLRGQRRYESTVSPARGDAYHALYLGTQYLIHGDQLKLMAGGEYATLSGGAPGNTYDGITWLTGIRFSF